MFCPFVLAPYVSSCWGDGRSYEEGFQSMGVLGATSTRSGLDFLLLDLQMIRIEPGKIAGSYGLAWRKRTSATRDLLGVNIFYDFRNFSNHYFNQMGLGFEYFTCLFDLRMNGYLPLGKKNALYKDQWFEYGDGYLTFIEEFQSAMWGLDFEIGKNFRRDKWGLCFFAGVGPYFYDVFTYTCCPKCLLGGMCPGQRDHLQSTKN